MDNPLPHRDNISDMPIYSRKLWIELDDMCSSACQVKAVNQHASLKYQHLSGDSRLCLFDPIFYIETYRDVFDANIDPLWHYINFGWREGRNCRRMCSHDRESLGVSEREWLEILVFSEYYLKQLPPTVAKQVDASEIVSHFLTVGQLAGISPNPLFDFRYYLIANLDVIEEGRDVIRHYLHYGCHEGRQVHPLLPAELLSQLSCFNEPGLITLLSEFQQGLSYQGIEGVWLPWPSPGPQKTRRKQIELWFQDDSIDHSPNILECISNILVLDSTLINNCTSASMLFWRGLYQLSSRFHINAYGIEYSAVAKGDSLGSLLKQWINNSDTSVSICIVLSSCSFNDSSLEFSCLHQLSLELRPVLTDPRYLLWNKNILLLLDLSGLGENASIAISRLRFALASVGLTDICIVQILPAASPGRVMTHGVDACYQILDLSREWFGDQAMNNCAALFGDPWISPLGLSRKPLLIGKAVSCCDVAIKEASCEQFVGYLFEYLEGVACRGDLLLIGHDAFNAGSQRAFLGLIRDLHRYLPSLQQHIVLLGDGPLLSSFRQLAPVLQVQSEDLLFGTYDFLFNQFKAKPGGCVVYNSIASLSFSQEIMASGQYSLVTHLLFLHELPPFLETRPELAQLFLSLIPIFDLVVIPSPMAQQMWIEWLHKQDKFASLIRHEQWLVMPPSDPIDLVLDSEVVSDKPIWPCQSEFKIVGFGYDTESFHYFGSVIRRLRLILPTVGGLWIGAGGEAEERLLCQESVLVPLALQEADLMLCAKPYESFGLIAVEALRQGCPVVALNRQSLGVAYWWPKEFHDELHLENEHDLLEKIIQICLKRGVDRNKRKLTSAPALRKIYVDRCEALTSLISKCIAKHADARI